MRKYPHNGFTLVETLVAITVLMIAIAGPLVIATKGLTSALYSKDQMIASFLAQESMEVIKNMRDNNIAQYQTAADVSAHWLDIPTGGLLTSCTSDIGGGCDAGGIATPQVVSCPSTTIPGCPIYYSSSGYTSNVTSSQTQFYRHFYVETVSVPTGVQPEVRAHIFVDWKEGVIPFQIHLLSTMVATPQ